MNTLLGKIAVISAHLQTARMGERREHLAKMLKDYARVVVVLHNRRSGLDDYSPLDFATRKAMIRAEFPSDDYPNLTILPFREVRDPMTVEFFVTRLVRDAFPFGEIQFFRWPHEDSPQKEMHSVRNTEDFRAGMVYAQGQAYAKGEPTVDIAVVDYDRGRILLGRKNGEAEFRFIGGYYDPEKDDSYESAARRELMEESNITLESDPVYVKSMKVDDWRKREGKNKIVTALFLGAYLSGNPVAKDDIVDVRWFTIPEFPVPTLQVDPACSNNSIFKEEVLVLEHRALYPKLMFAIFHQKQLIDSTKGNHEQNQ